MGLEHCIREVLSRLGNITRQSNAGAIFNLCDDHIGDDIFDDLAASYVQAANPLNLSNVWQSLGVELDGMKVTLNESAPDDMIRKAIVRNTGADAVDMSADAPDVVR